MKSPKLLILVFLFLSLADLLLARMKNPFGRMLQSTVTIPNNYTNLTLGQMHGKDVKLYTSIEDAVLHMYLQYPGNHWFGLGFGKQIQGSDVIIIEIVNDAIIVSDCIGKGADPNVPENDTNFGGTEDVKLVEWSIDKVNPAITVHMTRKLNTGDINDFVIPGPGPEDLFWVWSDSPTIKNYVQANGTLNTVTLTLA